MAEFNYLTALSIFVIYIFIDALYTLYIINVEKRNAFFAASVSALIYSLLAYGIVNYSKNIWYLIPLSSGAFIGTYITVLLNKGEKNEGIRSI